LIGMIWRVNFDPSIDAELSSEVEAARVVIEQSGDEAALASLEFAAGYVDHYRMRFGASFASMDRAMQHAARAKEFWFVNTAMAVAAAAVAGGPTPADEATRWLENAMPDGSSYQPFLHVWRAWLLACRGDFDEARALFNTTHDQLGERGMTTWSAISMQVGYDIERMAGDLEAAERMARQGCELLEEIGERAWLSTQACQLGEALYALGRYEDSERWALHGLELGGKEDVYTLLIGLEVRAKILARRGDHTGARSFAEEADRLAAPTEAPLSQGDAALALAEVLYLAGDLAGGALETRRAIAHYERKGATACVANAQGIAATWGATGPVG